MSLRGGSEQPVPPDEVLARFLRDLGVDGARVPVDVEERAAHVPHPAGRAADADRAGRRQGRGPGAAAAARHRLVRGDRDRPGTGSPTWPGSRLVDLDVLDEAEAAELFTRIIGTDRAGRRAGGRARGAGDLRGPAAGDQDRRARG